LVIVNLSIASTPFQLQNLTILSTTFWPWIKANIPLFQSFQLKNLTISSTMFWLWIIANLFIVSILFQLENLTIVSTIFWPYTL